MRSVDLVVGADDKHYCRNHGAERDLHDGYDDTDDFPTVSFERGLATAQWSSRGLVRPAARLYRHMRKHQILDEDFHASGVCFDICGYVIAELALFSSMRRDYDSVSEEVVCACCDVSFSTRSGFSESVVTVETLSM